MSQAAPLDSLDRTDPIDQLLGSIPVPSDRTLLVIASVMALLVAGLVAWNFLRHRMAPRRRSDGAYKPKAILTNNEIEFYNRLVSALPGYVVLSQVSMSAIIEPRTDDPKEYMARRRNFSQKYIDFIVCEPGDLRVVCIVELDDVTHNVDKDAVRDEMLSGAGYVTVRWHSRKKPTRAAIAKTIREIDAQSA